MPKAALQKHLPHGAKNLIDFVSDVEGYPKFINVISAIRILGPRTKNDNGERFEAEMAVSYKFFSERVRCVVDINYDAQTVIVRKSGDGGAIKTLINDWTFHTLSDGSTLVDFFVDVTLKSAPLNFLAKKKFGEVTEKIMDLFIRRAKQVCPRVKPGADLVAEIAALPIKRRV